jgi:hypothetical protein
MDRLDFEYWYLFACLPCPRSIDSAGPGPVGREIGACNLEFKKGVPLINTPVLKDTPSYQLINNK